MHLVTLDCSSRSLLMITFHMQRLMNLHMLWKFSWQSQTTLCSIVLHSYFSPSIYVYLFILIIYLFDLVFSRTQSQRETVFVSFCCHFIMSANTVDAFTLNRIFWIIQMAYEGSADLWAFIHCTHQNMLTRQSFSLCGEPGGGLSLSNQKAAGGQRCIFPKCSDCF